MSWDLDQCRFNGVEVKTWESVFSIKQSKTNIGATSD